MIVFLLLLVNVQSSFVEWDAVKGKNLPQFCDDIAVGVYGQELYVMHGKCQSDPNNSSTLGYNKRAMKLDISSLGFDGTARPLVLQKNWIEWQSFNYTPYLHPVIGGGEIAFSSSTPSSLQVKHNGMNNLLYMPLPTHSLSGNGQGALNIILEFDLRTKRYKNGVTFNNVIPTGGSPPENSCIMTFNERLYLSSGSGNDYTHIYNTRTGLWTKSIGALLIQTSHSGCAMNHDGTYGYIFGGYSGGYSGSSTSEVVDAIYEYDTLSQMWGTVRNAGFQEGIPDFVLSNGGRARSVCFADNRPGSWKIYCIGGVRACDAQSPVDPLTNPFPCDPIIGHLLSSIEIFDQETKKMTPEQSFRLSKPMYGFALTTHRPVFTAPMHANQNYNIELLLLVGGMYYNQTQNKVLRSNSIEYTAFGYSGETILTPFTRSPTSNIISAPTTSVSPTKTPTTSPYTLGSPSRAPVITTKHPTRHPVYPTTTIFRQITRPSQSPIVGQVICQPNHFVCYYNGNLALRCENCQETISSVCDSDNRATACSRNDDNNVSHSFNLFNITILIALNLLTFVF